MSYRIQATKRHQASKLSDKWTIAIGCSLTYRFIARPSQSSIALLFGICWKKELLYLQILLLLCYADKSKGVYLNFCVITLICMFVLN